MDIKTLSNMRSKVDTCMEVQDKIFYLDQDVDLLSLFNPYSPMEITLRTTKHDTKGTTINLRLEKDLKESIIKVISDSISEQSRRLKLEFESL